MDNDNRVERLRFRSWHRGTREMDLLMGSFADAHLAAFTPAQLDQYETLLEAIDPDLYHWVTGAQPVPVDQDSDVMRLFCAHTYAQKTD